MDLSEALKFALSDEAHEIYKKEGKEGLEKAIKRMESISKKKSGGVVRAMKNGGAVMKGRGPKFKGLS